MLTLPALVIAACGESSDPLGPPIFPPEDPSEPQTVERALIGPGGKVLGKQPWSWTPKPGEGPGSGEWEEHPFGRGPGISSETLARGLYSTGPGGHFGPPPVLGDGATRDHIPATAAFFAGGFGPNGAPAGDQAYFYDAVTDTWTDFQMAHARVDHALTTLPNGRFLIVGGNDATPQPTSTAEIFDSETLTLTPTGSMANARWGHAASPLLDGRVLVTGGQDASGSPILMAELFDPTTGEFTEAGLLNSSRIEHSQVTLDDGRILIVGGAGHDDAELWDPVARTFTAAGDMASIHGVGLTATKLPDGRVLVLGGDGSAGFLEPTDVAEIFDPGSGTFSPAGTMSSVRLKHFAILMGEGRVLIGGGVDESEFPTATAEVYDVASGSFTPIPDMPAAGSAQPAVYLRRTVTP